MAAGREDLLDEVERIWIKGELDRSLDRLVRIELDLVARPDAVELPMGMLLRRGGQQDVPLGRGRSMVTVFEELGRRLLILGDPGAGKTTLLLELTQGLLEQARSSSSEPMPVVFQHSSWAADRRPLAEWMVGELHRTYGVPRPLGWAWIDGNAIIPALDGLDEVPERERESCVDAINHFRVDHGQQPIVVCSRTEEYERLHNQLQLRNAVVIQPLDRTEVSTYLQNAGPKLAGLRTLLRHDRRLWDLLTTPLLLTFTVLSYRDRRPRARHDQESPEGLDSRRDQLLADYVDSRLYTAPKQPAPGPYLAEQMIRWLGWLGQGMRARNQSIFYIDGLQPDWLPNRYQQRMSAFGAAFITALVTWLSTAPLLPLGYDLELRGFFARLTYPTRLAVGFGVVLLPAAALIALVGGFDNRLVVRPPTPGAGIAACGRNAMVGGAATGAVTLLIGALAVFGYDTLILPLIATRAPRLLSYLTDVSGFSAELWVLISLVLVLMVAMRLGGASYIRHQLIRRLLVQAGATPADYQAFLDHASRLNLLRRRGGGYQFIHRLLLEHFANRAPAP